MEWKVYQYNINQKRMEQWNIFEHKSFSREVEELISKDLPIKEFKKELDSILMYYFWTKSEHEIVIGPFCGDENVRKKIDVYQQIKMNWEQFANYVRGYKYRWVSCEERLPDINTSVWVITDKGTILSMNYGIPDEEEKEPIFYKWDREYCYYLNCKAIAWKYKLQPCEK